MRVARLATLFVLLSPSVFANKDLNEANWQSAIVIVRTTTFGDVEVRATADKGMVKTLQVTANGNAATLSPEVISGLPPMLLSSLEVDTGRDRQHHPTLWILFIDRYSNYRDAKGNIEVALPVRGNQFGEPIVTEGAGTGNRP